MDETRLAEFVAFAQGLKGDEKSEAQTFFEEIFRALDHASVTAAGTAFDYRLGIAGAAKFSDMLWPGRVLIKMKRQGAKLDQVVPQAKAYRDRLEFAISHTTTAREPSNGQHRWKETVTSGI